MTTQTLSHLTLETLKNYRSAATQAVVAYRLGGHRLVGVVNGALAHSVYPRTAKLAPRATDRMNKVRGNVSDIALKGIDQVAERAGKAIELSSATTAAQFTKAAAFATGIDNQIVAKGLQAAARLLMPGAKVALAVSSKVAEGADALVVAAHPVRKAAVVAKRRATPVARKTKPATAKTATKRAAKRR